MTQMKGVQWERARLLEPPELTVGSNEKLTPISGRWNFENKKVFDPMKLVGEWGAVNFSEEVITKSVCLKILECAKRMGLRIGNPYIQITEDAINKQYSPIVRVEKMADGLKPNLKFILCILPPRKSSNIYGLWKKKLLCQLGIMTQCIAPRNSEQLNYPWYITSLALKINAKMGGINFVLSVERPPSMRKISDDKTPTLIVGIHVSHCSAKRSLVAVVSSRSWPYISLYQAIVKAQPPQLKIDSLFSKERRGYRRRGHFQVLDDFRASCNCSPERIIIFRSGVKESQFPKVLEELEQIKKACDFKNLKSDQEHSIKYSPKFTLIVAQKNRNKSVLNTKPGILIDIASDSENSKIDYYMWAHATSRGRSIPAHYCVLCNEIGFSKEELQSLLHSLSHVNQRSTTTNSMVAPIHYARLAMKEMLQISNSCNEGGDEGGGTSAGGPSSSLRVRPLSALHPLIRSSMFFC